MILNHRELLGIIDSEVITAKKENVNQTSIDVRLGKTILREIPPGLDCVINPANKQVFKYDEISLPEKGYTLDPGAFVLAQTEEVFNLPDNISAEFKLKSSIARAGLNHLLAGWCDPGWHGSTLTLELHNTLRWHSILLTPGMKIGQIIFFRHEPVSPEHSYRVRGRYNKTMTATASKGV